MKKGSVSTTSSPLLLYRTSKGVGRKISEPGWGGGKGTEKRPKNSKKRPKIALLSLFQEGGGSNEKKTKIAKRPKNITIKPLSTLSVPCMKIQGGPTPSASRCRRPCLLVMINFIRLYCMTMMCTCDLVVIVKGLLRLFNI